MRKSAPLFCALLLSLSARRAWIEIILLVYFFLCFHVALRKESVDRNRVKRLQRWASASRSPQGERG